MKVTIEGVSFDGSETGFRNQFDEGLAGKVLTGVGSGGMSDSLLNDRSVEIVCPEIEGKLRDLQPEHDPESLYVEKIVEKKPCDGDSAIKCLGCQASICPNG